MELADDVLALVRLAGRPGAVGAVLAQLAQRGRGPVAILAEDGDVLAQPPGRARTGIPASAARAVPELHRRAVASAILPGERDQRVRLPSLGDGGGAPYLAAVGPEKPQEPQEPDLLAHAAGVLTLSRRLERAERDCRRLREAEAHSREAVLHLLMVGEVAAAHRIAATLRPRLAPRVRVLIVECPNGRRDEVAEHVVGLTLGSAWLVPCPVQRRHLIALIPSAARQPADSWAETLTADHRVPCRVGVSGDVPLERVPAAYEDAFHALAVARGMAAGLAARSGGRIGVEPFLTAQGRAWARHLLAPCRHHTPHRRADPGPSELLGTLSSWLTFGSAAHRHLKVHRNTLAARLRLLDTLLGLDLHRVADQSAAWLALRIQAAEPHPDNASETPAPGALADLLATPAARDWARSLLAPLERRRGPAAGSTTVRAWLRADARLTGTAESLGISVGAVRKRLVNAEQALGLSLLHSPSARHALWLATTALGHR
ncbi:MULTISPECIES: helix-turn-helix domain-containing protein [unclassified Streptomyces]|uniref:helix-turn-helix domain-containing protein n=1 Tax=unclassified Streptomyces TaxID=2593676 RepID=UPI0022B6FEE6|nr:MULTISPECIES: helix-turn-helix domain-containing protein [unclassified Streptomyces]MCZ7414928.1 helix-turn-helix domain-containing protein [Streptomyces sp. WMMC897]MCZ7431871.1 helix-turn-helix domain-containing protein [Streptomyces sp. WMMC1477]